MLNHIGFSRFTLYGYELSMPDKPDFNATTEITEDDGRKVLMPKFMEMTVETNDPFYNQKRMFWTEPQYFAQFEEMNELIKGDKFKFTAQGEGVVPFMIKAKHIGNMRRDEARRKIMGDKPVTYLEMLAA